MRSHQGLRPREQHGKDACWFFEAAGSCTNLSTKSESVAQTSNGVGFEVVR